MRLSLIRSESALRHAMVGVVIAVSLAGCVAYVRGPGPGPGYYGAVVDVAPPAPRVIEVPPPRAGFVWAPGYWSWNGREHVWIEGRWIGERPGYRWVPDRWEQYNGRWRFIRGHWER